MYPKNTARLFYIKRRLRDFIPGRPSPRWAKFRLANAMFVWIGPVEIGWRMPWAKAFVAMQSALSEQSPDTSGHKSGGLS